MPSEIERKFLVANENWRSAVIESDKLIDGVIGEFNGSTFRVCIGQNKASLTVKGPPSAATPCEFEYDIPKGDAMVILATVSHEQLFEKTRYAVEHNGLIWHIDVYEGRLSGITIAEIVLEYESQYFKKPDWVDLEVTDNPYFHKRTMGCMRRDAGHSPLINQ